MPSRRLLCLCAVTLVLESASTMGCKKVSTLETPGETGGAGGGDAEPASPRYEAYAEGLRQKTKLEMTQSGEGQFLEVGFDVVATVRAATAGNDLKVLWDIDAVEGLELEGAMAPGSGDTPAAWLQQKGHGAYLINRLGEMDTVRLRGLVENKAFVAASQGDEPGPRLLALMPLVLPVPSLPRDPLPVGTPVVVETSDEIELAGTAFVLPTESETTFTLMRIQETKPGRIAEIQFQKEANGAAQNEAGDTVTITSAEDGTILFNLDRGYAVSYDVTRTETFTAGPATFESTTVIRSTWEPL